MKSIAFQTALCCALATAMGAPSAQPKKPAAGSTEQTQAATKEPKRLSPQEIFARGFDALQNKDGQAAVDLFRAGLEGEPSDPNAWLYLSKAQTLVGDTAGAEQSKAKAIALGIPATSFETRKLPTIALPHFPVTTTLAAVSFSPEIAKRLVEDPDLRLPEPFVGADADAKPQFNYRTYKDADSESHNIDAPFYQVLSYSEGRSLGGYKTLTVLSAIDIKGRLFGSTPGEKFAIRTETERANYLAQPKVWGYTVIEWFTECTALRPFSSVAGAEPINAAGTLYECAMSSYAAPTMTSLQAARSAKKNIATSSTAYYAYIPSKRRVDFHFKENAHKLNDYR